MYDFKKVISHGLIRGNWDYLMRRKHKKKESDEQHSQKVGVVMSEFKKGKLKSSSGKTVTDPKQAQAIALSEARRQRRS